MNKFKFVLLVVVASMVLSASAYAAPIVTITHDYGSGSGQMSPPSQGAGSCDTLNTNSVTIRDGSGCQRFYDMFDFTGAAYSSITSFQLDLTFSSTNQTYLGIIPEDWRVRPAVSPSVATTLNSEMPALTRSGPEITQSFVFNSTLSIFNTMVANEKFGLWFAEQAFGANNFNLNSAKLTVIGDPPVDPVPEPTSFALVGLGLAGAAISRRRCKR